MLCSDYVMGINNICYVCYIYIYYTVSVKIYTFWLVLVWLSSVLHFGDPKPGSMNKKKIQIYYKKNLGLYTISINGYFIFFY